MREIYLGNVLCTGLFKGDVVRRNPIKHAQNIGDNTFFSYKEDCLVLLIILRENPLICNSLHKSKLKLPILLAVSDSFS